jgi:glucokinase
MDSFAIGIDLGGTNLRIAAVTVDGALLEKISSDTEVARGRDHVIDQICKRICNLIDKFGVSRQLIGIGIGVPGIIDLHTGMVRNAENLPGWRNYPVKEEIERRLGTTVILENDANVACLGEKWLGAGMHVDDMCMLTLGTGVGGGMVLQGRIWHGMTGMAGELGHVSVDPNGVPCSCGNQGCLEQYASATAVKRIAMELLASGEAPDLVRAMKDREFGAEAIYQKALEGSASARQVFHRVGWALGVVLATLVNIFNLPMYVIGGGVANAWRSFAPAMLREVRKRSVVYVATMPDNEIPLWGRIEIKENKHSRPGSIITRALLGDDAGLLGAARLPMLAKEVTAVEPNFKGPEDGRIVA